MNCVKIPEEAVGAYWRTIIRDSMISLYPDTNSPRCLICPIEIMFTITITSHDDI